MVKGRKAPKSVDEVGIQLEIDRDLRVLLLALGLHHHESRICIYLHPSIHQLSRPTC